MASIAALVSAGFPQPREDRARRLVQRPSARDQALLHVWSDGAVTLAAAWSPDRPAAWAACEDVRVVCDGRFDDRAGVRRDLAATGRDVPFDATDATLLACAYATWGPECLARLSGEFAACIWDARTRTLVVARDRFGIKPLFHAARQDEVVVCSALTALRRDGGHAEGLSDEAIGDLLLFGFPQDPGATCFAGLSRVPPASSVTFEEGRPARVSSYWRPSAAVPLRHRTPREYVDHFRETLRTCVLERLEGDSISIFMSGGMDSASVAALATGPGGAPPDRCLAVTAVYDTLFADQERRFSTIAARALSVHIRHVPVDHYDLFDRWDGDALPPEPSTDVLSALTRDLLDVARRHGGVALGGDGGDPSLMPGAVVRHLGHMPLSQLLGGLRDTWRRGLWPPLGLRSTVVRWTGAGRPACPPWLSSRLQRSYDARARWAAFEDGWNPGHEMRGEALRVLGSPGWGQSFETWDPNTTGLALETRYPFFDHRMVSLALALPSYPWCVDKTVLREAMAGHLPDEIRLRPKAPLAGDPVTLRAWPARRLVELVRATPGVDDYIDPRAFERSVRDQGLFSDGQPGTLAAASLATWLRLGASQSRAA